MRTRGRIIKAIAGVVLLVAVYVFSFSNYSYADTAYSEVSDELPGYFSFCSEGNIQLKVLAVMIDPYLCSEEGLEFEQWYNTVSGNGMITAAGYLQYSDYLSVKYWCDSIEEMSHNTVELQLVSTIILNEFPKYKNIDSLDNEAFLNIFEMDENGYGNWEQGILKPEYQQYDTYGQLDYAHYINELNLVERRNEGEFDLVLLYGIDPLSPLPFYMVGRNPLMTTAEGYRADCDNFFIITSTLSRPDGALANAGHLAECMIGYTYGKVSAEKGFIDGTNYEYLNDWQKYCLCKQNATSDTQVYGYGMSDYAPNSDAIYDVNNGEIVKYYSDWRNGMSIQDFNPAESYVNNTMFNDKYSYAYEPVFNYIDKAYLSHQLWWLYNLPCEDGRDEEGYYNNWWRYIFTPDYVENVSADDSYKDGNENIMTLNIGERASVLLNVELASGKVIATDTTECGAVINCKNDGKVISITNGRIKALKTGYQDINVMLDGKAVAMTVYVDDPNAKENSSGGLFQMGLGIGIGIVVSMGLIAGVISIAIIINKHNKRRES